MSIVTTLVKVAIEMKYKSLTNIILGVYNLPIFKSPSNIQISQQYSVFKSPSNNQISQQYSNLPAIFKSPSMLVRINLVFGQ